MTHIKPKTIRRLTRLVKSLDPLLKRVPAPLPRPGSEAFSPSKDSTAEAMRLRREAYERADAKRLDKGVVRFFADAPSWESRR